MTENITCNPGTALRLQAMAWRKTIQVARYRQGNAIGQRTCEVHKKTHAVTTYSDTAVTTARPSLREATKRMRTGLINRCSGKPRRLFFLLYRDRHKNMPNAIISAKKVVRCDMCSGS